MTKIQIFALALVVWFVPRTVQAQTANDFQRELQHNAATRSRQELSAYIRSRILMITTDEEEAVAGVLLGDSSLYLDGVLLGDVAITMDGVLLGDGAIREIEVAYCDSGLLAQTFCLDWGACLEAYERDLSASTTAAMEMVSTCETAASPASLITCGADILAEHSASISAIRQRRSACRESALRHWLIR